MTGTLINVRNYAKKIVNSRKFKGVTLLILSAFFISLLVLYVVIKRFITQELLDQALTYGFLSNSQIADINNASHNVKHLVKLIFSTPRFTYYYAVVYIYTLILIYAIYNIYNFISVVIKKLKHREA